MFMVFCAMTFLWLACYAVAVAKMADLLGRSPVRRALDMVTGTVLVALGGRARSRATLNHGKDPASRSHSVMRLRALDTISAWVRSCPVGYGRA